MSAASAGPPPLDSLLASVRNALEEEYRLREVRVSGGGAEQRVYSTTWKLDVESSQGKFACILKWAPSGAARERELATLARDVAILASKGYTLRSLHGFDLFPNTAHIECVAALDR